MGNTIQVDHDAVISEPLEFHDIHAQSIEISADHRRVRRTEGLRGLCFSHRPLLQNELVCLRVSESLSSRRNKGIAFRFGYTAIDPTRDNLQTSPDLSTAGYWVKAVNDSVLKRGGAVFFYLSESGEVIYGRKDKEYGVLFSGVRTDVPLWVVIDLAGSAASLELLDGSLGSLKTEASKLTKAAVAKYQSRRNPKLSRSTDALSTSSADAVRQSSQDDLQTPSNSMTDRQMRRQVSTPGQPHSLTTEDLDVLEATSGITSERTVENDASRSSRRSARGVDAPQSRQGHRQSSVPTTLTGDPGVGSMILPAFGVDHPLRITTSAVTSDALVIQTVGTELFQNPAPAERSQVTSSHHYQRRAPNVNEAMPFHHTTFGRNILLSEDRQVASRLPGEFSNAYVFTERPLLPDDELVLQIGEINDAFVGGLTLGLTTTDPASLSRSVLPDDPRKLLDRPEYWVVHRNVHTRPKVGNELCFHLMKTGELKYYKNGRDSGTIMHVDCSLPMWLFIDVYGITQQIKSMGVIRRSNQNAGSRTTSNGRSANRVEPVSREDVSRSTASDGTRPSTSRGRHPRSNRRANGGNVDGEASVAAPTDGVSRSSPAVEPSNGTVSSQGVAVVTSSVTSTTGVTGSAAARPTAGEQSIARPSGRSRYTVPVPASPISDLLCEPMSRLPPPLIPLPPGSIPTVSNDLVILNDVGSATSPTTASSRVSSSQKRDNSECAICLENEPDSALYPCGHMCMCYECAVSVQKQRSALCPMCRQPIVDILRIYRN